MRLTTIIRSSLSQNNASCVREEKFQNLLQPNLTWTCRRIQAIINILPQPIQPHYMVSIMMNIKVSFMVSIMVSIKVSIMVNNKVSIKVSIKVRIMVSILVSIDFQRVRITVRRGLQKPFQA